MYTFTRTAVRAASTEVIICMKKKKPRIYNMYEPRSNILIRYYYYY